MSPPAPRPAREAAPPSRPETRPHPNDHDARCPAGWTASHGSRTSRTIAALITWSLLTTSVAAPGTTDVVEVRAVIDNDEFVGLNRRDRWYSSGGRIGWTTTSPDGRPSFVSAVPCAASSPDRNAAPRRAWSLLQNIYTQNERDVSSASPADRPIGALLAIAHERGSFSPGADRGWGVEVGVTGPAALGEQVQNGLHGLLGVQELRIWNQQLRPRLSFGLRAHCVVRFGSGGGRRVVPAAGWEVVAGSLLTQIAVHASIAIGPAAPEMRPVREARLAWPVPPQRATWGLIAGLRLRAVARDRLFSGPVYGYENPITPRDVVGEFFIGGQWRFSHRWQIGYAAVRRTREFGGPGVAEAGYSPQTFGQITVRLAI